MGEGESLPKGVLIREGDLRPSIHPCTTSLICLFVHYLLVYFTFRVTVYLPPSFSSNITFTLCTHLCKFMLFVIKKKNGNWIFCIWVGACNVQRRCELKHSALPPKWERTGRRERGRKRGWFKRILLNSRKDVHCSTAYFAWLVHATHLTQFKSIGMKCRQSWTANQSRWTGQPCTLHKEK